MTDLEKMLAALTQAKVADEVARTDEFEDSFFKFYESPAYLKLKVGENYSFRILWAMESEAGRKEPFIDKHEHKYFLKEDSEGKMRIGSVVCPVTPYMDGRAGYDKCPICAETSKWWRESKNDRVAAKKYREFRTQFNSFALIYVTADSQNQENVGKVMFIRYGKGIRMDINKAIFGLNDRAKGDQPRTCKPTVGASAFDIVSGYDCEITVTEVQDGSRKWPSYALDFSRDRTSIPITQEFVESEAKRIEFDRNYTTSTPEELTAFHKEFILGYDELEGDVVPVMAPAPAFEKPEVKSAPIVVPTPKPVLEDEPISAPVVTPAVKPAATGAPAVDVSALLARINSSK